MRKLLLFFIVALLLTGTVIAPVLAQEAGEYDREIGVVLDGMAVDFDVAPLIQNNRTLVPFRAVAEALNINVRWDNDRRQVIAGDDSGSVILTVDSPYAQVNKSVVEMDTAPIIIQGRTLVPLRFFAEAFGCEVDWKQETRTVVMISPPKIMSVTGFYALGDKESSSWTDLFAKNYPETGRGNTDIITDLALGWFSLDEKGNLLNRSTTGWQRPEGWERVIEAARHYKMDTEMLIHITDGGGQLSRFLNDNQAVERAIEDIVKEARLYNGVNLDFEGLGWNEDGEELQNTRFNFNLFVEKLSRELKKESLGLTLTLHAPNSSYQGYDYEYLGKAADYIIIMAYDYGIKPEPVQMVRQAVEMARETVPGEKLLLGISAASETPESLAVKIGIARRYKLEGIAVWRLGLLSDNMWDVLRARIARP